MDWCRSPRRRGGLLPVGLDGHMAMMGEHVKFIESGEECFGHVVYYRWPFLYTAVYGEDGHLRTLETHRLEAA
jgi:hypothetical protein